MIETPTSRRSNPGEEIANSITHGIGIILAIAGLGVLTAFAGIYGNAWHMVSVSIFGGMLILMYTASTLYHSVRDPHAKAILQVLDHCAIFLLIAGTYTPFTLVTLHGPWGWSLFGVIWGLAILGIVLELTALRRYRAVSIGLYLGMGWALLAAIKPMLAGIAPAGLILLLAGGLSYTVGISFYGLRKLRFHHAIWHLFVLAGSALHFFAILFYVIPVAGF
ncbi:hemolysin III [Desulfosarcina alkanivorans]|uniref:Hemolysin III n=1 Tax=Desulfosarcina alkanivorans TaxID=571177 RepID=A0A5K7YKY7_9BACT|nr:hemolysin III family protein [Desulfosarcina alkanivorans]BBO70392.1 hemolysin III [Desulfosarcina alkanivorans]